MPTNTQTSPTAGIESSDKSSSSPRTTSNEDSWKSNRRTVENRTSSSSKSPYEHRTEKENANDLTLQTLEPIASTHSDRSSSASVSLTQSTSSQNISFKESALTWRSSLRRIVSVLNLAEREKTPSQKLQERKLREADMLLNRPAICRLPLKSMTSFCLSLSGCGFLGSYHFGAVSCMLKNGQHIISRLERVSGASAGSLVASLLLLKPDKIGLALEVLYALGDELNRLNFGALTPGYYLNERLIRIVDDFLPHDISPAQGRLYVSLTLRKERVNKLVCNFSSREHLIHCLMASCYIPMYSMGYGAQPPIIDGEEYIDGGYTNNLPDFEDIRTVTISPFSGNAEISPLDAERYFDWKMTVCNQTMNVNLQNIVRGAQALFPPSRAVLESYFEAGFKDAFNFLIKHDIVQRSSGTEV
ncbi:Patatin like phospholipase domain containing 4 [Trichostrongylus colubriformis]|uniref:Patatin like phospholipase domain containing 4 n=1 Tax=Trichostrongylus colubriformis TaxID=6319 RepID=A0AAN8FD55_TRICO